MSPQGVFAWSLRHPLRMVDVEDDVALAHVKVPGDDGGGVNDLNQNLVQSGRKKDQVRTRKCVEGDNIGKEKKGLSSRLGHLCLFAYVLLRKYYNQTFFSLFFFFTK